MKPRTLIIGLDGVPYSLLKELQSRGHIPNMAALFQSGYLGQMNVCIPEISSVSWSSFLTGTQSGEHGIYGFIDLEPGSYILKFPNFTDLKAPTLIDELSSNDKKAVVINMPSTYPARQVNGVLISGFVAIDINKAVYPSSIIPSLNEIGYRIDLDTAKARQDHEFLFHDLDATLAAREKAVDLLWKQVDWDLFGVVITGTDRLMHFLWDAFESESHPYHSQFIKYFGKVDAFVGRLFERFQKINGTNNGANQFYMLSDHGFTKIKTEVYLNRWLQDNGFLKFEMSQPKTIMDIGAGSAAFVLDPSRIYINLKGKYPLGTVGHKDYASIRREIKNGLEALTFNNNEKVVKKVYTKEELYSGKCIDLAPDLVVLGNHGFDLKGKIGGDTVFGSTDLTGMHSQDDAFFYSSSGAKCKTIFDAKDIILTPLLPQNK